MNEIWFRHLQDRGAILAEDRVQRFVAAPHAAADPVLCDLSHYGAIRAGGQDAGHFLHGQLTNDVLSLDVDRSQWNAWCSPKGRMLVSMLLWREAGDYILWMPRALVASTLKRLRMFVLRAKVVLAEDPSDTVSFGLIGARAAAAVAEAIGDAPAVGRHLQRDGLTAVGVSGSRILLRAHSSRATAIWDRLAEVAGRDGVGAWDFAIVRDGIIEVRPETVEAYVPQMANLELVDGLSFNKGCYPGQEIVARTQYRGILKRRMARCVFVCKGALPPPGTEVFAPEFGDQAAGSVAIAARHGNNDSVDTDDGGAEALVVAQRECIAANSLRLGAPDGPPLDVRPLPYAIPE